MSSGNLRLHPIRPPHAHSAALLGEGFKVVCQSTYTLSHAFVLVPEKCQKGVQYSELVSDAPVDLTKS